MCSIIFPDYLLVMPPLWEGVRCLDGHGLSIPSLRSLAELHWQQSQPPPFWRAGTPGISREIPSMLSYDTRKKVENKKIILELTSYFRMVIRTEVNAKSFGNSG